MFFILSKLLNWFVYPLSLLFVGLLAVLVFYHRRRTRWVLALVLLCLYVLSTPLTVKPLARWLEGPYPTPETLRQHYDVAIVLTGMVHLYLSRPGAIEFNGHVERILEGIHLVRRGVADRLLITGGSGDLFDRRLSEATILRTFALELGLRDEQVLVEAAARNTYENAVNTAELLRAGQYRNLVLITSALHMPRAAAVFRQQGLAPDLYPVDFHSRPESVRFSDLLPSLGTLGLATYIVHELIGILIYRWQGYI